MTINQPPADDFPDLGGDDNFASRHSFGSRKSGSASRGGRKALQLCRQVQRALSYAMGETGDDVLLELHVESVEPAPNEKRLMVTVSPMGDGHDPVDIMQRLQFATPFLRNSIAAAIHRKRVPELMFRCVPPETE